MKRRLKRRCRDCRYEFAQQACARDMKRVTAGFTVSCSKKTINLYLDRDENKKGTCEYYKRKCWKFWITK